MQRVKVDLPETFQFSTKIQIRITDLNYGSHVGNDSFLSIIHEARIQYLYHFGYTELNFENTSLIMADAAIEYKAELVYGDIITVKVNACNFDKIGFDIFYLIEKEIDTQNVIAAKVKTGMMCFDYSTKKRLPVPEQVILKFAN